MTTSYFRWIRCLKAVTRENLPGARNSLLRMVEYHVQLRHQARFAWEEMKSGGGLRSFYRSSAVTDFAETLLTIDLVSSFSNNCR
jgi:hypothetical protein